MPRSAVLPLLALLLAAPAAADSTVTVPGSGSVSAPPDTASFTVGVTTEAPNAADAVRQNSAAVQHVLEALSAAGVPSKNVQTTGFSLGPVYADRQPGQRPRLTGYRASNQVAVEVQGIERVGALLDRAVAAGANDVGGIAFSVGDPTALLDEARRRAAADARHRAELYAVAAGLKLGRLVRLEESGARGPSPLPRAARMEMAAPPPIAGGEVDLQIDVTATFALEP
jgi:uncharacterized protein YggE